MIKNIDRILGRYGYDINEDDMGVPPSASGGAAPPMGGGMPPMGDMGGGMPGQGQGQQAPDNLPGDPVGAAKFSKLFASINSPQGGFLPKIVAQYSNKYPDLTSQIDNKTKQLTTLKGEIDILLGELTKQVSTSNSADQEGAAEGD